MKLRQIALRVLAGIGVLAILIGSVVGFRTWRWLTQPAPAPKAPATMVLELDLTHPVVEQPRGFTFSPAMLFEEEEEENVLLDLVRALDRAKEDPRVKGVVARMGSDVPSLVHVQEIRDALKRFRDKGKFSYVFAPSYGSFGLGNRAYYLASAFENIWLQPVGTVGLTGLGIEAPFAKTVLDKIGVGSDFMRREEYKSVMENATRSEFSAPVRANMESMMKNLGDQFATGIAESRKVTPAKVRDWMARGPYTASEAFKEGLVTRIGYLNEMLEVANLLGTELVAKDTTRAPVNVSSLEYLSFEHKMPEPKATFALINASGLITDASVGPQSIYDDRIMNTDKIVQALDDAAEDNQVDAILFRVNSPGGAPDASETIRHAIEKAQKSKKPVFVSMGEVAASGGYWIAMNADRIVAEPGTLTGSIGVVAGKFIVQGLSEKLGITWDSLSTSDNAQMWSVAKPFSPHDRERVNALLDDTYGAFTGNVAKARKIPPGKMGDVAKGRVFTGQQALDVKLVDELGGMQTTIAAMKKHFNLNTDDVIQLKLFPPPITPATIVLKLLKAIGFEAAFLHQSVGVFQKAQQVLGPLLEGLESRGAVVVRMPGAFMGTVR